MSKGLGQKIAIQFSEEINEVDQALPTYRYFRWEIDTSWSSIIYVYGIELLIDGNYILPTGVASASGQYSTLEPARAFDGSTSTYWRPNTYPCWIQIELPEAVTIKGFRWNTQTTLYRPRRFKMLGSNDGENWDEWYADESPDVNYWKNFTWDVLPNITYAFKITGQEYKYVNGPLVDKEYQIISVENHPTVDKTLLLTMHPQERFHNVEGPLTVQYNQIRGSLIGRGGPVEGFTETFTPTDLEPKPNPHVAENIEVSSEASVTFTRVTYNQGYADEQITVSVTATVDFIYVGVINP